LSHYEYDGLKCSYDTTAGIQGPKALRDIVEFGDQFRGFRDRVNTIEEVYRDLWTFWIAVDRQFIGRAPEIIETLEEKLDIQCDRVFRETYLKKLPGFDLRRGQLTLVKQVAAELVPSVMESVTQQSALSGEPVVDTPAVLEALKSAIEARAPKRAARKPGGRAVSTKSAPADLLGPEPAETDDQNKEARST
jgi:hypothetical protein